MGGGFLTLRGLPTGFALSDEHDLMLTPGGSIAVVSGVDALPQRIKTGLSHQKCDCPFHRDFGTRFVAKYYQPFDPKRTDWAEFMSVASRRPGAELHMILTDLNDS
jgi:hypothetical protein